MAAHRPQASRLLHARMSALTRRLVRAVRLCRVFGVRAVAWPIRDRLPFLEHRQYLEHVLYELLRRRGHVFIIQIGAHVGDTENDPVHRFIRENSLPVQGGRPKCSAILVEPVRYLFEQLAANYRGCEGVVLENVAIADRNEVREFYRLDENVDLRASGMPEWLNQVGSLLRQRMGQMWDQCEQDQAYKRFISEHTVVDRVQCITFDDLLHRHQIQRIDFLQIDAEGYDYEIIRTIDFDRVRPTIINYERGLLQETEPRCRRLLLRQDYILDDHGQDTLCLLKDLRG